MTGECYLTLLNRQVAEREGFEPSVPVTQYARLAIWCLRPLGHLSTIAGAIIKALSAEMANRARPVSNLDSASG